MRVDPSIFAPDFKTAPYWWEAAPRPRLDQAPLPARVDVAVVGSGYTGLCAALTLARGGRSVAVIEAGDPGHGASSRNAGFVGKTFKHSFATLLGGHGPAYATALYRELGAAFDYVAELVERERIACHFVRCGRFMAARTPAHYEAIARELELKRAHLGEESEMVPRAEQHREIGSELFHGGAVVPGLAALHPGLYQLGLLERAQAAGAQIIANTPVTGLEPERDGVTVATPRGTLRARDVVVATNGHTGAATPYFRRRIIPFRAYMIATEPCGAASFDRLLPARRTCHDYNHNLTYLRPSPDGTRILLGGRTGSVEDDIRLMAARLRRMLARIFPDLDGLRLSHAWSGYGGATFDLYPHLGAHRGIHYAMGYCFAGLPMGSYLGHKVALRILGSPQATTAFDGRPFPARAYYWGRPWFVPLATAYYDWLDRRGA